MKKFFQMKVMLENLGSHIVSNVDLWESGLCSRSNQAPQATNFYLKATGKDLNIYFSYNLNPFTTKGLPLTSKIVWR